MLLQKEALDQQQDLKIQEINLVKDELTMYYQLILEKAEELLAGQKLAFTPDRPVWDGDTIHYYYDETILVVTWKEIVNNSVYTVAEVKVAHPSQFRRHLSGEEFGSGKLYLTSEMSQGVNAVLGCSGDYYSYRRRGFVYADFMFCLY